MGKSKSWAGLFVVSTCEQLGLVETTASLVCLGARQVGRDQRFVRLDPSLDVLASSFAADVQKDAPLKMA